MTLLHETRVWLGWRKPAAQGGPADWPAFRTVLGSRFLPETWRVMTRYGLLAYGPSVLSAADDAQPLAWPDETAVLAYGSVTAYEEHRKHPDGKKYGAMHGDVFTKNGGPRGSRSAWAPTVAQAPDDPLRRLPAPAGTHFAQPDALLTVVFLSAPAGITAAGLMAHLPQAGDEAVVWCVQGMAIAWLASRQPLVPDEVLAPIRAQWPELRLHQWQSARPVALLQPAGIEVQDNMSWRMCRGLTEVAP